MRRRVLRLQTGNITPRERTEVANVQCPKQRISAEDFESTSNARCNLLPGTRDYLFFLTATEWDAVVPWDETSASESALVLRWALHSALESLSG